MDKIEIEGELDRIWIASLMAEGYDTYQIIKNYELTEDLILQCSDLLDKEVLLQGFIFSEQFIRNGLENEFLESSDLGNLNMGTYAGLSSDFIEEYSELLNWNRILVFLSTQTNSFTKYVTIIEEENLWSLISANDLPIDFIRHHKEKLDWNILSLTKCFSEDERNEFQGFIIDKNNEFKNEETELSGNMNLLPQIDKDYSVDDIADMIDKYLADINKDFYTK